MTTRRPFSRPRTKVYDCNYNMGETYYKPTLDSLDRKSRVIGAPKIAETIDVPEPPQRVQRPRSMIDLESVEGRIQAGLASEMEEEMASTVRRIRAARAAAVPTPEEGFQNAFHHRRDEIKKRFSEKMLDSVGINGALSENEHLVVKKRASRLAAEDALAPAGAIWTAMDDSKSRSLRSRTRLADIEAEMEEMAERGAARERRAANLRQLLVEDAEQIASSIASTKQSIASKKLMSSVVTEKRSIAF